MPVTCGSYRGTAFYIGEGRFLTAWHVVAEAETLHESICIAIAGELKFCRLEKLDKMDAAIIISLDDLPEITPIELLKTDFRDDDLEIIGYPQELGNGIDFFGVNVKNLKEMSDTSRGFDVMVLRTDSFGFHSYSGFSGSPVLNKKGVAVGIVTDQMYNTLGYTSISSISDKLREKHVKYLENADNYDMRTIGIGTCEELAEKACQKMRSRYTEKNHVKDEDLETKLQIFCGYDSDRWARLFRKELNEWYQILGPTVRAAVDRLTNLKAAMAGGAINYETAYDIDFLLNKRVSDKSDKFFLTGNYRSRLIEITETMGEAQEAELLEKERFLYVHGDAGSGKTQHMCRFVQTVSEYRNVYLLFGTDFESGKSPLQSICEALEWVEDDVIESLNAEMEQRGRYATFIIDALNEGEGTYMWTTLLPTLRAAIEPYQRIKLVVTVRTMEPGDQLSTKLKDGWKEIEIKGFANLREAIELYFKDAGINEKADGFIYVKEFQHPLFLKIFCQVYHRLPQQYRKELDILLLYLLYYQGRNDEVSHMADEDPELMVTPTIMRKIGYMSLSKYQCSDIPREESVKAANDLCPNRLWSKNLYHALIRANLLMEYRLSVGRKTAFQYDSMGDYMRAYSLMTAAEKDEDILQEVLKLVKPINDQGTGNQAQIHIKRTIKTFLAEWNPAEDIWKRDEFINGELTQLLLESLELRNLESERSTLPEDMVTSIVLSRNDYISPYYLLKNFTLYRDYLMESVHDKLMNMKLVERDEKWTLNVNRMHDDYSYFYNLRQMELEPNESNARAYIRILCWMMSASHPQLRYHAMRTVQGWLREFSGLCKELIEKFYLCNDPYILRGVYGIVYGALLVKRDKTLTHDVAETIYKNLYENQTHVPGDIEVRSWTLKILELNHLLNLEDDYWTKATPPYKRTDNLMAIPTGENFDDDAYFGEGSGAKKLHHSLFHWDFNRYIIGTNSRNESRTYIKDGKPVDLDDITMAIAYRIKHVYGYSQALSDYDDGVEWEERVYRQTERIGKKYQWIALGEVKAYLCDTCQMKKDWWGDEPPVKIPYPWYDSKTVTFEPTLTLTGNRNYFDQDFFDEIEGDNLMEGESHEWLKSRTKVPKPYVIVKDKEGREWVNIVGYQKFEQRENEDKRESFVFFCPCLVKKENADAFELWAKDQCFYGRWMPEDSGHYEYFWNEFPWSDSYKSLDFEEEMEILGYGVSAPCKVMLPYASQLQENYECIEDEEEFEGMIYMPSADMFEYFGLHTAERGVTRDKDGNVVALCRNIEGDILDTMVMRRDMLNQYLTDKGLVLFYCMLAEKRLKQEPQQFFMQRLSSCLRYELKGAPKVIQPMTDEEDFPEPEPLEEEETIEGISPEMWLQIDKEGGRASLLDLLKDYDKEVEERKKRRKKK